MIPISFSSHFFKTFFLPILLFLYLSCPSISFSNENTSYISDFLIINLKSSINKPYKIVAKVRSDDKLEIIKIDGKYSKVRTEKNKEGWIATQYLTKSIPKSLIIQNLEKQLDSLKITNKNTLSQSKDLENYPALLLANSNLNKSVKELTAENDQLKVNISNLEKEKVRTSEFIGGENVLLDNNELLFQLQEERDLYKQQKEALTTKNQELVKSFKSISATNNPKINNDFLKKLQLQNKNLQEQVIKLENERMLYWFISGAIVFFLGMLAGKIFGRKSHKYSY